MKKINNQEWHPRRLQDVDKLECSKKAMTIKNHRKDKSPHE